jgi:protein subunit release factor B
MKKIKSNQKSRELLFSVTAGDCRWDYYKGSGAGGQKRNKTSNAVRCTHKASGAVGRAEDTDSQHKNRWVAFRRMTETDEFKKWNKLEAARCTGVLAKIDERIVRELYDPSITKVEYYTPKEEA